MANSELTQETTTHTTESAHEHHTLYGQEIFSIGNFHVTNTLFTSYIALVIILVIGIFIRTRLKLIPKGIQHIGEILLEQLAALCDQVTQDRKITNMVLPVVVSIFVFVLLNNWLGILPGIGSIFINTKEGAISLFRGGTADINTTLTLGIFSVVFANLVGIFSIGLWKSFTKYVRLPALLKLKNVFKDPVLLVVVPVDIFVGLLEILGEIAKIASLSFRLFGNIFAGEVLLASMAAILAFGLPTPFLFLEFFVGVIQAFIISLLTVVYVTLAVQDHSEHDEHAEGHGHTDVHGVEKPAAAAGH